MKPTTFWTVNNRSAVLAGISTGNSSSSHMRHSAPPSESIPQILLKTRAGSQLGKRQAHLFGDHSYNSVLNAHTTIAWFFAILSPKLMRILFNKRYNQTGHKSAEQKTEQLRFGSGNLRQPSHETK